MRYYDIVISNPKTGKPVRTWTSHPNGLYGTPNPGALNVEFDIFVSDYGEPMYAGGSSITIQGIGLEDLRQAQLSTAVEKCARWRRKTVPAGLIEKVLEALVD